MLTCVTTTTATSAIGPFNAIAAPLSTTFDGVTGQQIVDAFFPGYGCIDVWLTDVTLSVATTTTTTTERHGLNGKIFDTSTATSLAIKGTAPGNRGTVSCNP